jgi:hypothetical protein
MGHVVSRKTSCSTILLAFRVSHLLFFLDWIVQHNLATLRRRWLSRRIPTMPVLCTTRHTRVASH